MARFRGILLTALFFVLLAVQPGAAQSAQDSGTNPPKPAGTNAATDKGKTATTGKSGTKTAKEKADTQKPATQAVASQPH